MSLKSKKEGTPPALTLSSALPSIQEFDQGRPSQPDGTRLRPRAGTLPSTSLIDHPASPVTATNLAGAALRELNGSSDPVEKVPASYPWPAASRGAPSPRPPHAHTNSDLLPTRSEIYFHDDTPLRTMDYLGLDDSPTPGESFEGHSRMRSNTVGASLAPDATFFSHRPSGSLDSGRLLYGLSDVQTQAAQANGQSPQTQNAPLGQTAQGQGTFPAGSSYAAAGFQGTQGSPGTFKSPPSAFQAAQYPASSSYSSTYTPAPYTPGQSPQRLSTHALPSLAPPRLLDESDPFPLATHYAPMPHSPSRTRSATISNVDNARPVFMRPRAGTTSGLAQLAGPDMDALSAAFGSLSTGGTLALTQAPSAALLVTSVDPSLTRADLAAFFGSYGSVTALDILKEGVLVQFASVGQAIVAREGVHARRGRLSAGRPAEAHYVLSADERESVQSASSHGHGAAPAAAHPSAPGLFNSHITIHTTPTPLLYIVPVPYSPTTGPLVQIFAAYGHVTSAQIVPARGPGSHAPDARAIAIVEFSAPEDAAAALAALHGTDCFGPKFGSVRITFAQRVPLPATVATPPGAHTAPSDQLLTLIPGSSGDAFDASEPPLEARQEMMAALSVGEPRADVAADVARLAAAPPPPVYHTLIPSVAESTGGRKYTNADTARLRDIRKRLDGGLSARDADALAAELLDEVVALATDYIGNTIVQKLFERAGTEMRLAMIARIGPYFATIGTHKNGTWAAQKIIQVASTPREFDAIRTHLEPYTPPLLLNDFGNYVIQGTLRFGAPYADFVYTAMACRCWEICSGRFGARSTRQTLESPHSTRYNVKRVATAIIFNACSLLMSANGSLLITWLLDTSELPGRYLLVARQFDAQLPKLCCHKIAAATVLKIVNQRVEPEAAKLVLSSLFDDGAKKIEEILLDQANGAATVQKIVTSSFIDHDTKQRIVERVKHALASVEAQGVSAYRKLYEDVGVPFQGHPGEVVYNPASPYVMYNQHNHPDYVMTQAPYAPGASSSPYGYTSSPQYGAYFGYQTDYGFQQPPGAPLQGLPPQAYYHGLSNGMGNNVGQVYRPAN